MELQEFLVTIGSGGADVPRLAQEELKEHLQAKDVLRSGQARFFFRADFRRLPPEAFEALRAPEKLYALVLRQPAAELAGELAALGGAEAEEALAARVAASPGWPAALEVWRAFASRARAGEDCAALPRTFRVTGKRAGTRMAHLSSNGVSEIVGEALAERHGWRVALRGFDVEVVLHLNDDYLLVALPLLERKSAQQSNFALPGLSQPVAWAMARSASIAPGELVLDPMCGSGIILLEAAQCWAHAVYLGVDSDASQISRSVANFQLLSARLRSAVSFVHGAACRLPLADASCDVVLCDLPFGKQYGSVEENATLYPAALAEFRRVLKAGTGRAVLLTNQANAPRLGEDFLASPRSWTVTCRRRILLGHMEAVLFLAEARPSEAAAGLPPETTRLPWEDGKGRARWGSLKAMVRQPLQPVMGAAPP